jgi:hypothetical protein
MFITESNIAAGSDESFVDIFAALFWTDYVGSFLEAGGKAVYYFHYIPLGEGKGCENTSAGTFAMFTMDKDYKILQPNAQFFAGQMINLEWVQPGSGEHRVFPSSSDVVDSAAHVLVTSYAVLRPDGQWSLMLVNKDQLNAQQVGIWFRDSKGEKDSYFSGPVTVVTFGSEQYQWHSEPTSASGGSADPDGPAARLTIQAGANTTFTLPKASVTVLRGAIAAAPAPAKTRQ